MLTRCPQCETIFKVSKKHISAAKGLVRCGSCKGIFNAKEHVIKSKKDLKKVTAEPSVESQTPITATAPEEKNIVEKTVTKKQAVTNTSASHNEPDSFDFLSHGFTSNSAREKFDLTTPPKQTNQHKKPTSKADALERGNTTNINFDSIFNDTSTQEAKKENTASVSKPATFKSKTLQPHKATVVKPVPEKESSSSKASSFISQNVIEFKNAFNSISKKITTKVVNKIQLPKRKDETDNNTQSDSDNIVKQPSSTSSETTTLSSTFATHEKSKNQESPIKPTTMSLTGDSDVFTIAPKKTPKETTQETKSKTAETDKAEKIVKSNPIRTTKKPIEEPIEQSTNESTQASSKPIVKEKPKLKQDAALKLAIQLKKAALEKNQSITNKTPAENVTSLKQKSDSGSRKDQKTNLGNQAQSNPAQTEKTPKPSLNVVDTTSEKHSDNATQNQESKPKLQLVESEVSTKIEQQTKATTTEASNKTEDKTEKTDEKKTTTKDSKLIPKEESKPKDNTDDEIADDSQMQIHIENGDIPMVLRESLEELDLPSRSTEMTLFMIVSMIVLSFGLFLQFSVFRSIEVQQKYPALKPLITKICKTFTCDYSGPRDIKKIQLINRDIRVHPNTKGALLISATIINNANFQQPYPNFSVRLSNLSGKTVAQRYFSPSDYLGKLSNKLLLMPSKQPIRVSLEVVDPGKEAINFEFKFLSIK